MPAPFHWHPTRPRNGRTIRRTPDPAARWSGPLPLVAGGQGRTSREVRVSARQAASFIASGVLGLLAAVAVGAIAVGTGRLIFALWGAS